MITFNQLNLDENLISVLEKKQITSPTPIQEMVIPAVLNNDDIIASAPTGTGKTLAFLIPVFQMIDVESESIQAVILTPTRELALQIHEEAKALYDYKPVNTLAIYGGQNIGQQLKKLKKNIHLVIATPGRLTDHLTRNTLSLQKIKWFIIDEVDQMLLKGFQNAIDEILEFTPKRKQSLFFSATINSAVKKLAYAITTNPVNIDVNQENLVLENITQYLIETTDRNKFDDLSRILKKDSPFMAIIFCRTKARVDQLEEKMSLAGFDCKKIHSDLKQRDRERIMKLFRKGEFQYLIATEVASRGLDITHVSHIYNYDIPQQAEDYIHRIGRTGRMNKEGISYLLIDPKDLPMLNTIENAIGFKLKKIML